MSYYNPPTPTARSRARSGPGRFAVHRAMRSAGPGGVIQLGDSLYEVVPDGSGLGGFSLKKVGKAIGKAAKQTVKVVKKVAPVALAFAPIPVVGGVVAKALAAQKAVKNLSPIKAIATVQKNVKTLQQRPTPVLPPTDAVTLPQYIPPPTINVDPQVNPRKQFHIDQREKEKARLAAETKAKADARLLKQQQRADAKAKKVADDAAKKADREKARAARLAERAKATDATAADQAAAAQAAVAANAATMQAQAAASAAPSASFAGGGGGGGGGGYGAESAPAPTSSADVSSEVTAPEATEAPAMGGSGMLIAAGIVGLLLLSGGKH